MRPLEPFSYFIEHASAISGFGGAEQGPDPRYCFHTHYEELRAGRVIYRLRMVGARASMGELTVRVHAHKPGSDADVSLVGGAKQLLESLGDGQTGAGRDVELAVAFSAVAGVQYALYGYFSEPSDLQLDDIRITVDERGKPCQELSSDGDRSTSRFAAAKIETPVRLFAGAAPSLRLPVSQDCTRQQLAAGRPGDAAALLEQWREAIALTALESYGMLQDGAVGIVLGDAPNGLADRLTTVGCRLFAPADDGPATGPVADFVVSYALEDATPGPAERDRLVSDAIAYLLRGGLAVFVLRYRAGSSAGSSDNKNFATRNEIQRWVLRLIGAGHDIAQIAFAGESDRVICDDGTTPFVMIVRSG